MPYPNEIAARLKDPGDFDKFKRTSGGTIYGSKKVPSTIDIIWGHVKGGPTAAWIPQALRFPITNWTLSEAKKWLKDNDINPMTVEDAVPEKRGVQEDKEKKKKEKMKDLRYFNTSEDICFRAIEEEGKRYLTGYASVFDVKSRLILEGGRLFYEDIQRGAFNEVLSNPGLDVIFTFNHDKSKIIARTISGTLSLSADDKGLLFKAEIPNNVSYANDVYELVKRGDLFSNSFAYQALPQDITWGKDENGNRTRSIRKVSNLVDVSVVVHAAFPDTSIAARDLEEIQKLDDEEEKSDDEKELKDKFPIKSDKYKRRLRILKQKLN
jgi:uncharacterized protein